MKHSCIVSPSLILHPHTDQCPLHSPPFPYYFHVSQCCWETWLWIKPNFTHQKKKQHLSVGCAALPEHEKKGCAWPVWWQLRGCEQPHPGPHHPQPGRHFSAACLLSARCGLRFTSACLWLCLQHGCCLATMWRGRLQVREGKLKRFNQFFLLHGSFLQLESPHLPSQGSTNEAGESCFKRKH